MDLTESQRIAHLLRRLGLGAGQAEVQAYLPLGVQGTIDRLINYENVDSGILMGPYQLSFEKPNSDPNLDPYLISMWWAFRMWATQRPFEEKLALFWHNHLTVGADKVEFGPMMVEYLRALYSHQNGRFADLLGSVMVSSAMLRYLDGDHSVANQSNENFAREVMELFTLGIGNYTEEDVHNSARIFTGFGLAYPLYEDNNEKYNVRTRHFLQAEIPMVGGFWSTALHDHGDKTILGKTAKFTPTQFIEILAAHPATAKRIGTKFFEHFAYDDPSEAIQDHMQHLFAKYEGRSKELVKEIVVMDEFWSEKAVRGKYKSPVDFVIALLRQIGIGEYLRKSQNPVSPITPVDEKLRGGLYYVAQLLQKQGMLPLYPPNVKGWPGGRDWISAGTMANRIEMATSLMWLGDPGKRFGNMTAQMILAKNPSNSEQAVNMFLAQYDAEDVTPQLDLIVKAFDEAGGLTNLAKPDTAPGPLSVVAKLAFSSPDFQFC